MRTALEIYPKARSLLLVFTLAVPCLGPAQSQFGFVAYTVPAGWSVVGTNDSLVILEPDQLEPVESLLLCLLRPAPVQEPLTNALADAWTEALGSLTVQPVMDQGQLFRASAAIQTSDGRTVMFGDGRCGNDAGTYDLRVYILEAGDWYLRVFGLANLLPASIAYPPTSALHNPRFAYQIPGFLLDLSTGVPLNPLPGPNQSLSGLWRGLSMFGGLLKNACAYFYADGRAYFGSRLPMNGFDELNTDADTLITPQYWGRYAFNGQQGEIQLPYQNDVFPFAPAGNHLTIVTTGDPHEFSPQPPVDGWTFEGTYFLQLSSGEKPTLTLSSGGQFADQGLLKYVDHWIYPFRVSDQPGEGRYAVTNFSMVFQYADGRVLRLPFSGLGLTAGERSPASLAIGTEDDFLALAGGARPRVVISVDAANPGRLKVRWPAAATAYSLQAAASLAPHVWGPPPEPQTVEGTENVVSIEAGGSTRFFRLVQQ